MSRAIAALRASPCHSAEPEPASSLGPTGECQLSQELRDRLLAAQLEAIAYRGMARRAAWALLGCAREAARLGVDVSYWRELAGEIEERTT